MRLPATLSLGLAVLLVSGAAGAQDAPTSLLPKGFDPPVSTPVAAAAPLPGTEPAPVAPDSAATDTPFVAHQAGVAATEVPVDPFAEGARGAAVDAVGPLGLRITGPGGGYGLNAFAGSDGRFVAGVMRRMAQPLASRWAHIVLRRALLTEATVPSGINPSDWIAERAWLLLRMGEADGAKALVDAVPVDRYTRKFYLVAGQAALAAADLPGLCPLAQTGGTVSNDPLWRLATAMCGSMTGDDLLAASEFDRLRSGNAVEPFDLRLAERVATVSGTGGRAANIDWSEVDTLTPYRFGLAAASGLKLPAELLEKWPAGQRGWVWRAAQVPLDVRGVVLPAVAVQGVASAQEMVDFASASSAGLDSAAFDATPAAKLRAAYAAPSNADKLAGMRAIWDGGDGADGRYAGLIQTALAAAAFPVDRKFAGDATQLIAAMLSAGAVPPALRWWAVADAAGGAARDAAWGLLAPVDPGHAVPVTTDLFEGWMAAAKGDKAAVKHRAALLLAGLDGLGKAQGGDWDSLRSKLDVAKIDNSWTRAIDAAAAAGRIGEVAVLAASAMQSDWASVPPGHFEHLIAALVRVGRAQEAGLIVAEAATRA